MPETDILWALVAACFGYLLIGFSLQLGRHPYDSSDLFTAPIGALLDMVFPVQGPVNGLGWHWRKRQAQMFIYRLVCRETPGNLTWRQTLRDVARVLVFWGVILGFFGSLLLWLIVIPITLAVVTYFAGGVVYINGLPLYGHLGQRPDCWYVNFLGWVQTDCYPGWKPPF